MIKLFSFRGRTTRLAYWRIYLLCVALVATAWTLGLFAMMTVGPAGAILFAAIPPAVVISWATSLRRLHDRGKNLWWLLLFQVAPLGLYALASQTSSAGSVLVGLVANLVGLGLSLWGLVEMGFLRGEQKSNRFGDNPTLGVISAVETANV